MMVKFIAGIPLGILVLFTVNRLCLYSVPNNCKTSDVEGLWETMLHMDYPGMDKFGTSKLYTKSVPMWSSTHYLLVTVKKN
jgi:hypothetical protein